MLQVSNIVEVVLYCPDLKAAENFYKRVLGLRLFRRRGQGRIAFQCGEGMFLISHPEKPSPSNTGTPIPFASGGGHIAFHVPSSDLSKWEGHLARLGIKIEKRVEWPTGGVSIYVRDPGGNTVELTTIQHIPLND